jgi:nucleoredoxin
MENLIGNKFLNNKLEEVNPEEVLNCKVIALFFTASWCSPCEIFSKDLIEVHNEANQGEKVFEIIQISFDKTDDTYKKSVVNKPWVFLPFEDLKIQELTEKYEVLTIPMFFVLYGKDGQLLTETGRKEISEEGYKIVDKWLSIAEERK